MAIKVCSFAFPMIVRVRDYHEFRAMEEFLSEMTGEVVRYQEVPTYGCDIQLDQVATVGDGSDYALFWVGESDDQIKHLLQEMARFVEENGE